MENKSSLYYILVIIFLCKSCVKPSLLEQFNTIEHIEHQTIRLVNDEIYHTVYQFISDSNYLIAHDRDMDSYFSLTDLEKNEIIARFGRRGMGPGEVNNPPSEIVPLNHNEFCFWDYNLRTLFTINYNNPENDLSAYKAFTIPNKELNILNLVPLKNEKYVGIGLFDEGRYLLLDSQGRGISYNYDYPQFDGDETFSNAHKAIAFQGHLRQKPDGNRFYFACTKSEILEIFSLDNNKITKIAEYHGEYAQFVPETFGNNSIATATKKESKVRFVSTDCTDEYIYLLYSGRIIADGHYQAYLASTILVFDWDGKPVKRYNLDKNIRCITINQYNNKIYGYDQESEQLVSFDLK